MKECYFMMMKSSYSGIIRSIRTYSNFCQHVFGWVLDEGEGNQPRLGEGTSHIVVHDELGYLSDCSSCSNHWNGIHVKFPGV